MPTHRLDIGLKGMAHYVDKELHGTSGLTRFPDGLHVSKGTGPPAPEKHFVRKKGFGMSIEWKSNKDDDTSQSDAHRPRRPPGRPRGQPHGRPPGPPPGERRRARGSQVQEQEDQDPGPGDQEQGPGLFDVSSHGGDDDDAHPQAHWRPDGSDVNFQHHNRHRHGRHGSDRAMSAMSLDPFKRNTERPLPRYECPDFEQWELDPEIEYYQYRDRHPPGYEGFNRASRAMSFDPDESYEEWPTLLPKYREPRQLACDDRIAGYEGRHSHSRRHDGSNHATRVTSFSSDDSYKSRWPEDLRRHERGHRHRSKR